MNKRAWTAIVAAAVAAVVIGYGVSPWIAAHRLKAAVAAGDRDQLESLVDFPSVRDSVKSQLTAVMTASFKQDPELANKPFSGLAAAIMPMFINQMVDAYITPDGLTKMMEARAPKEREGGPGGAGQGAEGDKPTIRQGYVDLDTFRISVEAKNDPVIFAFVMRREGLFAWRLKRLELPVDALASTPSPPS